MSVCSAVLPMHGKMITWHCTYGNFIVITKQEILVISLTDFSMLLHDVIMTSYCCQQYAECLVSTLFQHTGLRTCNS